MIMLIFISDFVRLLKYNFLNKFATKNPLRADNKEKLNRETRFNILFGMDNFI